MLPVKTPLTGRKTPENFAPEDRSANLKSADNSTSAENEFGRIMDRAKPSEMPVNRHLQNDRPTCTSKIQKSSKVELNADEVTTKAETLSKTEEAVSKKSCQPVQTDVSTESDLPKTSGSESIAPVIIPTTPLPVLITLPLAAAFGCGSESAATNESDSGAQFLSGQNISALLTQPVTPGGVSKQTGNVLTSFTPANDTASALPENSGQNAETIAAHLADLKPTPSERPIDNRSVAKDVLAKKSTAQTSDAGVQSKMIATLQPSAADSTSAISINLPAVSDDNTPQISSETSATEDILPATIIPAATGKNLNNGSGTGVATDAGVMKKAEKQTEVAGLGEKVLPGGKVDQSPAPQLRPVAVPALNSDLLKPDVSISFAAAGVVNPVLTETTETFALPSLAETQLRTVERTAEMMSFHALRLAKNDTEIMQVVIRPGAGTELSLELRQRNGEVEVHAVLQRGDHQALNQHWPELQERMEQRGIKLSSLGGDTNYSFNGNGNFSRQQNSQREEVAQQASAFAEFTMAMNRGGATARLATTTPGANEWWA